MRRRNLSIYLGKARAMQFTWHGTEAGSCGDKRKVEQRVRNRIMDKKRKLFKTDTDILHDMDSLSKMVCIPYDQLREQLKKSAFNRMASH